MTQVTNHPTVTGSSSTGAVTTSNKGNEDKTVSKLEEVLRRQRERLENLSDTFKDKGQARDDEDDVSQYKESPLKMTQRSEGVFSTSTNNLEKAYEDLEREIMEIKQKLQGSAHPTSASGTASNTNTGAEIPSSRHTG